MRLVSQPPVSSLLEMGSVRAPHSCARVLETDATLQALSPLSRFSRNCYDSLVAKCTRVLTVEFGQEFSIWVGRRKNTARKVV
jgi:hypothetical protein